MSRQERRQLERQSAKQARKNPAPAASVPVATGPRTEAGKAISSRNSLSHGLTASNLVLPWENRADFDGLFDDLITEHQPVTITEQIMVKEMAENYWRLLRARTHEYTLLAQQELLLGRNNNDPSALANWEKSVTLTQRYITRFERGFHKCLATLRTLQKERRAKEAELEETRTESAAEPVGQFVLQNLTVTPEPIQPLHQFVSQNDEKPVSTQGQAA